jgi:hypothetical protein
MQFDWRYIFMRWFFYLCFSLCALLFAKEPKLLVLIVASDDKPYYTELQKVWRSYMNYNPEQVEAYFLKSDPNLDRTWKIEDQIIWTKTDLNIIPGMADRTILSFEAMLPRLKEFDFVVRTNLSSFYVFPRLLEFVKTLPKTRCYHACENKILRGNGQPYIPFGSGAGLIFSPDLVEMMVREKQALLGSSIVEDVLWGWFFHYRNVPLLVASRMDILNKLSWIAWKHYLPENQYHFRLKNPEHRRLTDEVQIHREMAEMFYPCAQQNKSQK